jgi:hypothetical protein
MQVFILKMLDSRRFTLPLDAKLRRRPLHLPGCHDDVQRREWDVVLLQDQHVLRATRTAVQAV